MRYIAGVERRRHDRHRLWVPIEIVEGDARIEGVVHDVSHEGVLAVTRGVFEVGARVTVCMQTPDGSPERRLEGTIVRVGLNSEDKDSLWPREIGVRLDDAIPEWESLLALASMSK